MERNENFAAPEPIEEEDSEVEALVSRQFRSLPRDELQKAQLDRTYIASVLAETLEEICRNRRFDWLMFTYYVFTVIKFANRYFEVLSRGSR